MSTITLVVEMPEDGTIETAVSRARLGEGRLLYAYRGDAVADLRYVLANRGTPERLDAAAERVDFRWAL